MTIVFLAVLTALSLAVLPDAAESKRKKKNKPWDRSRQVVPGVVYRAINLPKGPHRIRILQINLRKKPTLDVALAKDLVPGFEPTSSMARRHGAIAAINADYALSSGRPVHTFAEDGDLAQTPWLWGRNFSVSRDKSSTYIDNPIVRVTVDPQPGGAPFRVQSVNQGHPTPKQIAMYTPRGGTEERPPQNACSVRLYPISSPRQMSAEPGVQGDFVVDEVGPVCKSARHGKQNGIVLATPQNGSRVNEIMMLQPGQPIGLVWTLGWPGVVDTVGGNPTLVEDGVIVGANVDGNTAFHGKHPRTGVGTTPDGKVLLVTVDGRQPGYSEGMRLRRFARLFRDLGADRALNLDGGGSTTMFLEGKVMNRPSDGPERGVSSAILVLPDADPGEAGLDQPEEEDPGFLDFRSFAPPLPDVDLGGSPWEAVVSDPASTGGLADLMMRSGRSLPDELQRAVRSFRSR